MGINTTGKKSGLQAIGYLESGKLYLRQLADKAGKTIVDAAALDQKIDSEWANGSFLSYKWNGVQTAIKGDCDERHVLVNTGNRTSDTGEDIYAHFYRNISNGMRGNLIGVQFYTKKEFESGSLDVLFPKIDYEAVARKLEKLSGAKTTEDVCRKRLAALFQAAQQHGGPEEILDPVSKERKFLGFAWTETEADETPAVGSPRLFIALDPDHFSAFVVSERKLREILLVNHAKANNVYYSGLFCFTDQKNGRPDQETDRFYRSLANKAIPESWTWSNPQTLNPSKQSRPNQSCPILKNYLEQIYLVLRQEQTDHPERKVFLEKNGKRFFNSGLLNPSYEQILIQGTVASLTIPTKSLGKFSFEILTDLDAVTPNEACIAEADIPPLPSFLQHVDEVVLDAGKEVFLNDKHIYEDGLAKERLPSFSKDYHLICNIQDPVIRKQKYTNLVAHISSAIEQSLKRMRLMAQRNYKFAVPFYYPEARDIQFLLPMYLKIGDKWPECVLVLSRKKDEDGNTFYWGETILTLDMAYNNARLIAKPEVSWLIKMVVSKNKTAKTAGHASAKPSTP